MDILMEYWEVFILGMLFVVSAITYSAATRNRGSFVDAPDWSKIVRRIIELTCVFLSLIFIVFLVWDQGIQSRVITIIFPLSSIISVFTIILIVNRLFGKKVGANSPDNEDKTMAVNQKRFRNSLSDYLVNAIILTIFFLSALLILLIALTKVIDQPIIAGNHILLILDFFLSVQFAFLIYQLYYLMVMNKIPNEEVVQIIRICKNLNDE